MSSTRTADDTLDVRVPPDDPVLSLRLRDTLIPLEEIFGRRRQILIGRSPGAGWTIRHDDTISEEHCLLHHGGGHLTVHGLDTKNHTIANGLPLTEASGWVPLPAGSTLVLGETPILVCGRAGDAQEPYIAPSMSRLIGRARLLWRHATRAAQVLGVPARTLQRWLREGGRR
ncbi:FHA domain-containing protein [Haliangium sp.]|uniref:FHA domain-containing protein n=1 Tax=Haliangium sp. TaxID=2663208 RepID=UPI003D150004